MIQRQKLYLALASQESVFPSLCVAGPDALGELLLPCQARSVTLGGAVADYFSSERKV
jgi:hypothetical protein